MVQPPLFPLHDSARVDCCDALRLKPFALRCFDENRQKLEKEIKIVSNVV